MLQGGVAERAVALWQRAFPDLEVTAPSGPAQLWRLSLAGQTFTLFDSPQLHEFGPTPAWSFMVDLDDPAEVDRGVDALRGSVIMPADRYEIADRFAWVEAPFGLSWQ